MIITGAIAVSKLLMRNCSLRHLNVGHNNIGDDGISVIVEKLLHITTLTTLDVKDCGLSVKGTSYSMCKTYSYINMHSPDSENNLTVSLTVSQGIYFILK